MTGEVVSNLISLKELVDKTIPILKMIAERKNVKVINEIKECVVHADSDMVQAIVRNLISNALKFSHKGGKVVLSSRTNGDMVKVTVSEYGVGISKQQVDSLFKLDSSPSAIGTAGEKGTGIGMTLCKEMVERNGGKIWAKSTIGEGPQVYFSLLNEPVRDE
jgi:signal transduction histidine kinase